jgi:NADPH:quinone reductase-like Zn-dependent oxidoreductase
VIEQTLPPLQAHQVRVQTTLSAISAGTELLVFRNQFPRNMAVDANIDALVGAFAYPLAYGYALVGRVVEVGTAVERSWHGRRVFAFHPHASSFITTTDALLPIPHGISDADAVCLPNMETAVNLGTRWCPVAGRIGGGVRARGGGLVDHRAVEPFSAGAFGDGGGLADTACHLVSSRGAQQLGLGCGSAHAL